MAIDLYAMRHAESMAQTGEAEWLDPDLSAFGEEQARAATSYFQDRSFDLILLSPLRRARRTYELSGPRAKTVRFDSRLVECTLDRGPGYDYRELLPYDTPDYAEADQSDMWTVPAGQRVASLLTDLRQLTNNSVLLVAHNGFLNVLRSHIIGRPIMGEPSVHMPLDGLPTDNTGISRFLIDPSQQGDRVIFWNQPTTTLK